MKNNWKTLLGGVVLVVLVVFVYGYFSLRSTLRQDIEMSNARQADKAERKIASLFHLPEERPQVAFVQDSQRLKQEQTFFNQTENGDIIFVYTDRIIVYRPVTGKIVSMEPLSRTMVGESSSQSITIEVRNGTTTVGLAKKIGGDILKQYPDIKTPSVVTAAKTDYAQTYVYVKSEGGKELASKIATTLNAKIITVLPSGEKDADKDIIVIVGSDQK